MITRTPAPYVRFNVWINVLAWSRWVGFDEVGRTAPGGTVMKEDGMTRTMTALADRFVGVFAPKATAEAACTNCFEQTCYCRGIYLYKKHCCYTGSCARYECGTCVNVGRGC